MNDGAKAPDSGQNGGLRAARAEIVDQLGRDEVARLHDENPVLDGAAVVGSLAIFLALAYPLAVGSVRDPLWWACLVLQGNMILVLAMVSHDVFTHRKWLPPKLRWLVSTVMMWPSQLRPSVYDDLHLTHHRALGTAQDTESYKHGINTRVRRALFASPAMVVQHLQTVRRQIAEANARDPGSERAAFERKVWWGILALLLVSAAVDYRFALYGYVLPFVVVLPVLNTIRVVLEHYDLEAGNPFWVGTFYRTGPVTRIMFWWIGGDCHVIHHVYATIPWYRLPRAIRLIRPILLRNGVFEHRSLGRLLVDWFSARRPHWSVPAASQAAPDRRGTA
ncbi:fatty acid desaturase family protein [Ramlibacter sp. MMS24-I3-19]|uniref:fatty acid desaturase family protein n=1 Tax=Ramlibacter sp. MMS24-I3-19 TaxID=3416606 RepID=UPI003D0918DD